MNQSELIERLAKAAGITHQAAALALKPTFESMARAPEVEGAGWRSEASGPLR